MRRGTTPMLTFQLPEAINIVVLFITFKQGDNTVLEKTLDDVIYYSDSGTIKLPLTQEDTLKLDSTEPVWVQLRLKDNLDNAVASDPIRCEVGMILKDGVI